MENNLHRIEKDLRSIAKRYKSVKYSIGLAILFLMLGVSAFSEEVNTKTQVAQIATREELKTSVGDVQTKLNVLRENNKKEIKNLNLELVQLMEQGTQVVKSPWASWQFGMNFFYENWGGTYKGSGALSVISIAGAPGAFGASGGFISNELITISDISGSLISGAFNGVFTFGSTLGASIPSTTGSSIVNGIACLLTSFGEIRASISTSLVGSFIFNKSTNPQLLLPFVDEFIAVFFSIFTPPLDVLLTFFQVVCESFPGVNGVPPTF